MLVGVFRKYWFYLLVFFLGTFLRLVPELFSSVYPAGVDIPFYIYELRLMEQGFSLDMLYFGNPLPYFVMLGLKGLVRVDWLLFFKVFNPLLNGVVACSFLYFVRNGLGLRWKSWDCVLAVVLFLFSSSGVIMSNGIVKHQFAMVFAFVFLVCYRRKDFRLGLLFASLAGLCHLLIPLFLVLFLFGDFVYEWLKFRAFKWIGLWSIVVLVGVVLLVTFVVPALVSVDPVWEIATHFGNFFSSGGLGVRYNTVPIVERMWNHFVWYYDWWLAVVLVTFLGFYRSRVVNLLLVALLPLSFCWVGTFWGRFQWLLTYPFSVIVVGGTKSLYSRFRFGVLLLPLFVLTCFVVVNGCCLLTDTDWSMPRSSVPFDEIPVIEETFVGLGLTDDSLLLCSHLSYSWFRNLCLSDGVSPIIIDERRLVLYESEDGCLVAGRDGIKGHDFFVYRNTTVSYCLDDFDLVVLVDDGHFTTKGTFDKYWNSFHEDSTVGNYTIYHYSD